MRVKAGSNKQECHLGDAINCISRCSAHLVMLQVRRVPQQRCCGAVSREAPGSQAAFCGIAADHNYRAEPLARPLRSAHAVHAEGRCDSDTGALQFFNDMYPDS